MSIELGDVHAVNEFIYRQGFLKAAVQKTPSEYIVWLNASNNTPGAHMSKLAAKCALMTHCALREADADEGHGRGVRERSFSFLCISRLRAWPPRRRTICASRSSRSSTIRGMNSDYNVQGSNRSRTGSWCRRSVDLPYVEKHRIGDKMTFDSGDNMDTQTPMSLYNLSQQRGVGSLFEHGVVGSLRSLLVNGPALLLSRGPCAERGPLAGSA